MIVRKNSLYKAGFFLAFILISIVLVVADPLAKGAQTKKTDGQAMAPETSMPHVLSIADANIYRQLFRAQKRGSWRTANKLILKLKNKLLLGHVQAQRYLHPTKYRSRYLELAKWLKAYADHPDARRIYKLALRRKPKTFRYPNPPSRKFFPNYEIERIIEHSNHQLSTRAARRIIWKVRQMAKKRRLTLALKYLKRKNIKRTLGQTGYDLGRTHIAAGWFFYGNSKHALDLAGSAAFTSGNKIPYSHWIAGLSAYRQKKYIKAAGHFEAVTLSHRVSGFDHAAAAFWAARANMMGRRPERVNEWLKIAAAEARTFYGILARRWMGDKSPFDWRQPRLTAARLKLLLSENSGRRAIALLQLNLTARAGRELRFMAHTKNTELTTALIALADIKGLPMVSYRAGGALIKAPISLPARALYPIPTWTPQKGYQIDRALIFAFMRQESGFNVRAKSIAGARGLMQLMPATASFIAQKRFRGRTRERLYDPTLNISLGQKYIQHLLSADHINSDLLLLAAAYNGGPGNLQKWQRVAKKGGYTDPLMFIESIPALETRIFVERVLANLWMYRERLGEPAPSLDALASGKQPFYVAIENRKE
ncbi:MAG: lytic transglycosylase domain-containing protein [Pseudomonadota bacterium]|nr:lytic transglycosylase domain-containing protein [Pseudomonadota bacterium]